jgi:hypothetical protein
MNYMNVLSDFSLRVSERVRTLEVNREANTNMEMA